MRKRWVGRVYLGGGKYAWVGRFDTRKQRDDAVAEARVALKRGAHRRLPTCDAYVDRYLEECRARHKDSSYDTARASLKRFREHFAGRPLDSIDRTEAKEWAARQPPSAVPIVVTLFNHAIDEDDLPIPRNPFRKLGRRTRGRADEPPPTEAEFQRLLDACSALGDYAGQMRALMLFAAFTLMRPGEIFPLERADVDFETMRIRKLRRLYRGRLAKPKTGEKTIALTAPARDAVLGLPQNSALLFTSKTGLRLSQGTVSGYWAQVKARAGLDFDFYHATKHYGVHHLWTKVGLSRRAIAAQAGWSLATVDNMLRIYGHGDVGALEEIDRAFEGRVVELRDAKQMQEGSGGAA